MDISKEGAGTNKRSHEGVDEGDGASTDQISAGEPPPKNSPPAPADVAAKADHPTRPEADGDDTIDAATTATGYVAF
ncbi:hypothetical protein MTO96_011186 [Rhipicephalus appendiculatus]